MEKMIALMMKASIWPTTMASSLRPLSVPRRSVGASSAR